MLVVCRCSSSGGQFDLLLVSVYVFLHCQILRLLLLTALILRKINILLETRHFRKYSLCDRVNYASLPVLLVKHKHWHEPQREGDQRESEAEL